MEQSLAGWLLPVVALIVGVVIGFLLARLLPGAAPGRAQKYYVVVFMHVVARAQSQQFFLLQVSVRQILHILEACGGI